MLEKLTIQNYQSHSRTEIGFAPDITTIIGESDMGKSAVIRALRWNCTNYPNGGDFVRTGTKGAIVKSFVDGRVIERRRSASGEVNTYKLDDEEYKSFGRGVPEPIERLLNMPALCWQGQHDPSFWFGETAGEVSRQLNALVDLGCIDTALSTAARQVSDEKGRVSFCQESLNKAEQEAESLSWVPEFATDAEMLDKLLTRRTEALQDADAMHTCILEINRVAGFLDGLEAVSEAGFRMLDTGTRFLEADAKKNGLVNLVIQIQATEDQFADADKLVVCGSTMLEAYDKAYAIMVECGGLSAIICYIEQTQQTAAFQIPDFSRVQEKHDIYVDKTASLLSLTSIIEHITKAQEEICHAESESQRLESQMPKSCPTCGRSFAATCTCLLQPH